MFFFFDQSPAQFSLANVFNAYGPGSWLEPRIGGMWQENTGVTPTTSGGQTIGLLLDQSQRAQLGPELLTNGSFDTGIAGWSNLSATGSWDSVNKAISVTYSASASGVYSTFSTIAGRYYEVSGDLVSASAFVAQYTIRAGNGITPDSGLADTSIFTAPGSKKARFQATGSTSYVYLRGGSSAVVSWGNISVREILGNHASQATVANRPTLQFTNGLPLVRCDSNDFMTVSLPNLGGGVFSSSGSVYFALNTGMSALHNQSIGTSYSAPIQSMDLYGAYIFPNRLPTSIETQLQSYCKRLAGI